MIKTQRVDLKCIFLQCKWFYYHLRLIELMAWRAAILNVESVTNPSIQWRIFASPGLSRPQLTYIDIYVPNNAYIISKKTGLLLVQVMVRRPLGNKSILPDSLSVQ